MRPFVHQGSGWTDGTSTLLTDTDLVALAAKSFVS